MKKTGLKVIIPVAGAGTRLQPHTLTTPKALLHVGGKSVLEHVLESLAALEPEEVIFVIGHKGDQIIDFVRREYDFNCRFVPQEKLLGLGYALHLGLKDIGDGPVLILLGDTIVACDCAAFVGTGDYVLGLRQVDDPGRFGIAEVNDGYINGLEEKPPNPKTNLALIGLYYFSESKRLRDELEALVRSGITTGGEIQFTDALHAMIEGGVRFLPYEVEGWFDCGKKETLLSSNQALLATQPQPDPIDGSLLIPPVYVSPTAKIINSIIGPNVSIAEGVVIEHSIVRNSIVNSGSEIRDIVIENSLVGLKAVVRGSYRRVNVGDASHLDNI